MSKKENIKFGVFFAAMILIAVVGFVWPAPRGQVLSFDAELGTGLQSIARHSRVSSTLGSADWELVSATGDILKSGDNPGRRNIAGFWKATRGQVNLTTVRYTNRIWGVLALALAGLTAGAWRLWPLGKPRLRVAPARQRRLRWRRHPRS
ncbi:hypothetical protein KC614_04565 [candidate division WWE3 bacterium]|uniref:Uncharacterized protein n=1 Tax=candidate division WWE3 bacterium TaxID=2053526 RepID=A0A955LLG9_UNCKA|nr:hypothetical protein [candidate division WWE3 bacterium]